MRPAFPWSAVHCYVLIAPFPKATLKAKLVQYISSPTGTVCCIVWFFTKLPHWVRSATTRVAGYLGIFVVDLAFLRYVLLLTLCDHGWTNACLLFDQFSVRPSPSSPSSPSPPSSARSSSALRLSPSPSFAQGRVGLTIRL